MAKVLEIDVAKNTQKEREMNENELQDLAARQAKTAAALKEQQETAKAKTSAVAKLAALGLTDAEIVALIGA